MQKRVEAREWIVCMSARHVWGTRARDGLLDKQIEGGWVPQARASEGEGEMSRMSRGGSGHYGGYSQDPPKFREIPVETDSVPGLAL